MAASSGIGHMANQAREFMMTDVVVLALVIYALLGKLADVIARYAREADAAVASRIPETGRRPEP